MVSLGKSKFKCRFELYNFLNWNSSSLWFHLFFPIHIVPGDSLIYAVSQDVYNNSSTKLPACFSTSPPLSRSVSPLWHPFTQNIGYLPFSFFLYPVSVKISKISFFNMCPRNFIFLYYCISSINTLSNHIQRPVDMPNFHYWK